MSSLAEIPPSEVVHTALCGAGKFTLDEYDTVTQYDHNGAVVGIFSASDTPTLRAWIVESRAVQEKRGRIPHPDVSKFIEEAMV